MEFYYFLVKIVIYDFPLFCDPKIQDLSLPWSMTLRGPESVSLAMATCVWLRTSSYFYQGEFYVLDQQSQATLSISGTAKNPPKSFSDS